MLEEEKMLWNAGILGSQVPKQLVEMLLYLFGLHFALRTGPEHRSLRAGPNSQLQIKVDNECGLCYLKYTEDSSKNNPGGIKYDKKVVCAYKNKTMLECSVFKLYTEYVLHRPNKDTDVFYLRPLAVPRGQVWYSCVVINLGFRTFGLVIVINNKASV